MLPLASPFHHLSQNHPETNVCGGPSGTRWSCSLGFRPCSELRASGSMSKELARWGARAPGWRRPAATRSEEHTSELQSLAYLVCRLLLEKKKNDWSSRGIPPPTERYL